MGDRANVAIREDDKVVWLYTHWSGSELPETVRLAIARKQRWDDAAYRARIVFCTMVEGAEKEETGFGIWTDPCDTTRVIVLDVTNKRVQFGTTESVPASSKESGYSFEEYAALRDVSWKAAKA